MKFLAYIVYFVVFMVSMFVLHSANVGSNLWQFWAIELGLLIVCVCGVILGGAK